MSSHRQTGQALYQKARSEELSGDWIAAAADYRRAYVADPQGNFSVAALLGAMRLEWRRGLEAEALDLYSVLLQLRHDRAVSARASLFLAASDIVQGRTDRAGDWLADASRASRSVDFEVRYWRARLDEARGALDRAITGYADLLAANLFHPLAREAEKRLAGEPLQGYVRSIAREFARSEDPARLYRAWLLYGRQGDEAEAARQILQGRLVADPAVRSFFGLRGVPPGEWPLWDRSVSSPQELLLALGLWGDAAEVVDRHFPVANPRLALTAAEGLAETRPRRALLIAEILAQRAPRRVPEPLYPLTMRRALYPTAARLAANAGRSLSTPRELENPALAVELGASYLAELRALFGDEQHVILAAYNAGEAQAALWQRHCYTTGADEYFTKVGFRETRNYIARVLYNVAQYHDLYGRGPDGGP